MIRHKHFEHNERHQESVYESQQWWREDWDWEPLRYSVSDTDTIHRHVTCHSQMTHVGVKTGSVTGCAPSTQVACASELPLHQIANVT